MTGLNPDNDQIMSIACYVTDHELNLLDDDGLELIIHHEQEVLDSMNDWCKKTHGASGLSGKCLQSPTTPEQAADQLLEYIQKHIDGPRKAMLAGNTVHADKAFLRKAPYDRAVLYLHHRILDVSTIKEAARRWSSEGIVKNSPKKKELHDARQDILESIEEARYYRQHIFTR